MVGDGRDEGGVGVGVELDECAEVAKGEGTAVWVEVAVDEGVECVF